MIDSRRTHINADPNRNHVFIIYMERISQCLSNDSGIDRSEIIPLPNGEDVEQIFTKPSIFVISSSVGAVSCLCQYAFVMLCIIFTCFMRRTLFLISFSSKLSEEIIGF